MPVITREEVISLLLEAAELEHGLCCSYLYAAFTIKRPEQAAFTAEQEDAVTRWRKLVNSVAQEEMLHLSLVCNLLTAVGGPPHFERAPFPQRSRYYPPGITVELLPFADETITRFLYIERPEHVEVTEIDPALEAHLEEADEPPMVAAALETLAEETQAREEKPGDYLTVAHLYAAIEDGLQSLVERMGEDAVFIGPSQAQATPDYFHLPDLRAVVDLASAKDVLAVLIEQGEGTKGDWHDAHYGRFYAVREELRTLRKDDPQFEPAHPALTNPYVIGDAADAEGARIDDPLTVKVMELCNGCYQTMTHVLVRFFSHAGETDEALRVLVKGAVDMMEDVIEPLGKLLVTMPAGPSHPGAVAGPSFELYRSVAVSPHRRATWIMLHERLSELASFADRLVDDDGAPERLTDVAGALRDVASTLEPHFRLP